MQFTYVLYVRSMYGACRHVHDVNGWMHGVYFLERGLSLVAGRVLCHPVRGFCRRRLLIGRGAQGRPAHDRVGFPLSLGE